MPDVKAASSCGSYVYSILCNQTSWGVEEFLLKYVTDNILYFKVWLHTWTVTITKHQYWTNIQIKWWKRDTNKSNYLQPPDNIISYVLSGLWLSGPFWISCSLTEYWYGGKDSVQHRARHAGWQNGFCKLFQEARKLASHIATYFTVFLPVVHADGRYIDQAEPVCVLEPHC